MKRTLAASVLVASLASSCSSTTATVKFVRDTAEEQAGAVEAPVDPSTIPCPLLRHDEAFVEQLLSLWRVTLREDLQLQERPLPWTVLVGKQCVFQLNPRRPIAGGKVLTTALLWNAAPLVVHAAGHGGQIALPDGRVVPAGVHSFSTRAGDDAILVLSLMELWREHPNAGKLDNAAEVVLGVALHELAHTAQLTTLERPPVDVDDKLVQRVFAANEDYVAQYQQEADALWAAALADDDGSRRRFAKEALALAKQRRARFFVGEHAELLPVEAYMLGHEGIGEWVRVRMMARAKDLPSNAELVRHEPTFTGWKRFKAMDERAVLELAREQTKAGWTQESGLALLLVLDELAPDWRARLFADPPADPYVVLEEALSATP